MNIEEYRRKIKLQAENNERPQRPMCLPDVTVLNANGNPISRWEHTKQLREYRKTLQGGRR